MNHESFRELIALRLYRETDEGENARLERHLEGCADCRTYAREIEGGLGAVAGARRSSTELPADWSERLRAATRGEPRAPRINPWWTAVAGFAAGILAAVMVGRGPTPSPAPVSPERALSTWERFHRETPPPLATTEGQLARLGEYLRR